MLQTKLPLCENVSYDAEWRENKLGGNNQFYCHFYYNFPTLSDDCMIEEHFVCLFVFCLFDSFLLLPISTSDSGRHMSYETAAGNKRLQAPSDDLT